jgi:hypothetical protein
MLNTNNNNNNNNNNHHHHHHHHNIPTPKQLQEAPAALEDLAGRIWLGFG